MDLNNKESSNLNILSNKNISNFLLSRTPGYNLISETPNQILQNGLLTGNSYIYPNQNSLSPNDLNLKYFDSMYSSGNNINPSNFGKAQSPTYLNGDDRINYLNVTKADSPINNIIDNKILYSKNLIPTTPRAKLHILNSLNNNELLLTSNSNSILNENKPIIQNIVSTADLKCKLDLRTIALKAKNAEYNPKRFSAVIMRIKKPKTTALIFASGKMVCTGAKSEEESKEAARKFAKAIHNLNYDVKFSSFKIQNIVGSCDVGFKISLAGIDSQIRYCSYDPEVFPGLIFKMLDPKIVLLIFVSGKIVLTGAKERKEIYDAFQKILPVLRKHKKKALNERND